MRRFVKAALGAVVCYAAATSFAFAADIKANEPANAPASYRASKLTGMTVMNNASEKLGTIDDFVIDMHTGKVAYVALGVGGVLGVGERLFAVPFNQLRFVEGKNELHFMTDISRDQLKNAPGFDKKEWPNFADANWRTHVDNYYRSVPSATTGSQTNK